jgi:hypothetical protein
MTCFDIPEVLSPLIAHIKVMARIFDVQAAASNLRESKLSINGFRESLLKNYYCQEEENSIL